MKKELDEKGSLEKRVKTLQEQAKQLNQQLEYSKQLYEKQVRKLLLAKQKPIFFHSVTYNATLVVRLV